jgi:hypothetical protein
MNKVMWVIVIVIVLLASVLFLLAGADWPG